jgi:tRNA threonylcarbamoyladenosine biosynthesis protein TsaB
VNGSPDATRKYALAIEISNPSSGVRVVIERPNRPAIVAGPGVALGNMETGELDQEPLHEGLRHDDDLMPAVARLFERNGAEPSQLARVAVSVGPGGYTSLRIAVATAKMLAEATGAEVVAVPSFAVAAWSIGKDVAPSLLCLASKGENASGVLLPEQTDPGGRGWIAAARHLGLVDAATVRELRPRTVIGDQFLPRAMREAAGEIGARVIEPVFAAAFALQIAEDLPPVDPLALAPVYSREPEAVTQWRKRKQGP